MNPDALRCFKRALLASLLLHLGVLFFPGWQLPWLEQASDPLPLEATLVIPARPEPAVQSRPTPQPQPRPSPAPPKPVTPDTPRIDTPQPAPLPPPPLPPTEPVAEEAPLSSVPPASTFAGTWPKHGRIRFSVTRGEGGLIVGQATQEWWHDADSYRLQATTETVGLAALFKPVKMVQESRGIFVAGGLQPIEFKTERDGKLKLSLRFDPAQKLLFQSNGNASPLTQQTLDLLSVFFQLGALPPDAKDMAVTVATGRKIERYEIIVIATETIDTPWGTRSAQHVRLPGTVRGDAETSDSTEVWLDTVSRLPLRIRYRDRKGEIFDQTATAVELDDKS